MECEKKHKQNKNKRKLSRSWSETVSTLSFTLPATEVKRQEAIYELYCGELNIVDDLEMINKIYRNSLLQLEILSYEESQVLFGSVDKLLNLHQTLKLLLESLRNSLGMVEIVGKKLIEWIPGLDCYIEYCYNHVLAKSVLETKKLHSQRFRDFLKRCLQSPFSRKLDLWTYLDIPRTRLMKYPLLVSEILRHTPDTHIDNEILKQAVILLNSIIKNADKAIGDAELQEVLNHLIWPCELDKIQIQDATVLLCSGELFDQKRQKVYCFLFNSGLLITKPSKTGGEFYVNWPMIPACELEVEEIDLLKANKHDDKVFRVRSADSSANANFILRANDGHSKKRWMDKIEQVMLDTIVSSVTQRPLIASNF